MQHSSRTNGCSWRATFKELLSRSSRMEAEWSFNMSCWRRYSKIWLNKQWEVVYIQKICIFKVIGQQIIIWHVWTSFPRNSTSWITHFFQEIIFFNGEQNGRVSHGDVLFWFERNKIISFRQHWFPNKPKQLSHEAIRFVFAISSCTQATI